MAGAEGNPDESEWRFPVDGNLDPELAATLRDPEFPADHVLDVLVEGATDSDDVLPYCRERHAVLVTNDYSDFNPTALSADDHVGVLVVYDKERPPEAIATEIQRLVEAIGSRDAFRGFENADEWT
jgi:predicted nuclease of predicted toxin-antitoxin system